MQLLNLVGLNEQRWPEDLLTRSAMALVLLGILRASGYFGIAKISTSADTYTNNELFIGSLLLRHLQVLLLLHMYSDVKPYLKRIWQIVFDTIKRCLYYNNFLKVLEELGIL